MDARTGTTSKRMPLVSALAVGLVASSAIVAHAGPPTFRTERVYFHCSAPTKISNANFVASSAIPTWNTIAPSGASTGSGCVFADPSTNNGGLGEPGSTDGVWEGTFTGNVSALTVEADIAAAGTVLNDRSVNVTTRLTIDGVNVPLSAQVVTVTATPRYSGAAYHVRFSITELGLTEDLDGNGKPDEGPGTTRRTFRLQLGLIHVQKTTAGAWLYDASEFASGIEFNPATPAPVGLKKA